MASYLHRPGDEDVPSSRVGQLYLYDLSPEDDDENDENQVTTQTAPMTRWSFAPVAPTRDTRAVFELAWAPRRWVSDEGPVLAQADAGGFLTLYRIRKDEGDALEEVEALQEGGVEGRVGLGGGRDAQRMNGYTPMELTSLRCGGGGLGMTTCVAWTADVAANDGYQSGSVASRLAVVGADGGLRIVSVTESGDLRIILEDASAHDLEAWAVSFANRGAFHGSGDDVVFTGADDAEFKAWDVRVGVDAPVMLFRDRKTHGAGVTCVAPSPHDPQVVATGSYDDSVRLWDVRGGREGSVTAIESAKLRGGSWRARWHPDRGRLAVAAMDGGAVVLDRKSVV